MLLNFLQLSVGILLLYFGGEGLVRGASGLARRFGLSPLVIGLTVVAFGTSSPELAASLMAAFQGAPDVALGNVLGSNIANVGLILGFSALLQPMVAAGGMLRREVPFMILVGLLLIPLAINGWYGRLDGLLLLLLFAVFLAVLLKGGGQRSEDIPDSGGKSLGTQIGMVVGGILLLVVGADQLVDGAVALARAWQLPEQVIGLTMVAIGTSLPELAASVVAVRHGEGDIVFGNVIGSNIFNVLLVLGTTTVIHPIPVELSQFLRDLVVGAGFSSLVVPLIFLRKSLYLGRFEGSLLLAAYLTYIWVVFQ